MCGCIEIPGRQSHSIQNYSPSYGQYLMLYPTLPVCSAYKWELHALWAGILPKLQHMPTPHFCHDVVEHMQTFYQIISYII